jgi:excisionase family DNA binding protein
VRQSDACVSVKTAAKRLDMSVKTVYRLIHKKELPAGKIGSRLVIKESDLNAYISSL